MNKLKLTFVMSLLGINKNIPLNIKNNAKNRVVNKNMPYRI